MGLADALGAEDRAQVKMSDLRYLIKAEVERNLFQNALTAEIPRETVQKLLSGKNDDLEAFRELGLTPDQIREMDHLYAEKCKEVAILRAEYDLLKKQLEDVAAIATQAGLEGADHCGECGVGSSEDPMDTGEAGK